MAFLKKAWQKQTTLRVLRAFTKALLQAKNYLPGKGSQENIPSDYLFILF
jgi:hypothetical protein